MAKKQQFRKFAHVPSSGLKEIFDQERKYDSIFTESRRVHQYGKSIKVAFPGDFSKTFSAIVFEQLKKSQYDVQEHDMVQGNIIYTKHKQNRSKILKLKMTPDQCTFVLQTMVHNGELRTSLLMHRPVLAFNKHKQAIISFVQLFKRDVTMYGLRDELRKRVMRKQVVHSAAVFFKSLETKFNLQAKSGTWIDKVLSR